MKIFLASGASGGHLFPAIDTALELRRRGHEVVLLGSLTKQIRQLQDRGLNYIDIPTAGFSKGHYLKALTLMVKAYRLSRDVLAEKKPDVVIGFGGHGSFAPVMAAARRGLPTVIHEQNVVPGKANRWLSGPVRRIAISFKGSENFFDKRKTVLTGCPTHLRNTHRNRNELCAKWGFSPDKRTILVFGGSHGAGSINSVFMEMLGKLEPLDHYQVIHVSGKLDFHRVKAFYDRFGGSAAVFDFLDKMDEAYCLSDLVICRAGALTITELALFNKKAVLIPYPFAGAHQRENAREVESPGRIEVVTEPELNADLLLIKIRGLISAQEHDGQDGTCNEASKKIADLVLSLL